MAATTFDPNNKSSAFALSGSNLIATSSGAANVRATRSLTGLSYFEITVTTLTGSIGIGLCNYTFGVTGTTLLGTDNNGLRLSNGGNVVLNGAVLSTIQTFVQGDVVCVAVDIKNRLIWFRTNGGNWNNNASNDPATGVGGIDYSSMNLGPLFPEVSCSLTGAVLTAKFTSGFAQAVPSGFASVDTCSAVAVSSDAPIGASYGQIGGAAGSPSATGPEARASWLGVGRSYRLWTPAGAAVVVSGVVKEAGVAVSGKTVRLYDHNTGDYLGCATSDGSGLFSINALGRTTTFVVATDAGYNALIFDSVVPV